MKYAVEIGGRTFEVEVTGGRVILDGRPIDARLGGAPGTVARRLVRGRLSRPFLSVTEGNGAWVLTSEGSRIGAAVLDPKARAVRAAGARRSGGPKAGTLKAPMPGMVLRVLVEAGAQVVAGQGLVVVEAMKMENELKAAGPAVVKAVHVSPGAKVEKGTPLLDLG